MEATKSTSKFLASKPPSLSNSTDSTDISHHITFFISPDLPGVHRAKPPSQWQCGSPPTTSAAQLIHNATKLPQPSAIEALVLSHASNSIPKDRFQHPGTWEAKCQQSLPKKLEERGKTFVNLKLP
jgi:hypothetical protein